MKSNKTINKAKLTNTAKAVLPLFAFFGGQGFASSRNPLSWQSSRKLAGKTVVYTQDVESPILPILGVKKNQTNTSPFAAFTNKPVIKTQNAQLDAHSVVLDYLKNNNLLLSKKSHLSSISGNTNNRKSFSDNWLWSTRLANHPAPFTSYPYTSDVCDSNATFNGNPMRFFVAGYGGNVGYYCAAFVTTPSSSFTSSGAIFNPVGSAIEASCQVMHMACDLAPLPVELLQFEVD